MSRLDELIKELCPDGVEYKELKEVLTIKNGKDYKVLDEGEYPVYGSGGIMTYVSEYAYNRPSVLIPRKGSIDKLYYVEEPFWNVDTIFYTEINITKVVPRYVYFCLQREHLEQYNTAGGVPSLTQKVLNKVKIPVPPLKVQNEIVRILDNFTELTAELTARKKQYEHYRDSLLTFGDDVPRLHLEKCLEKTNNIKWKQFNGTLEYIDLSSVDRDLHIITQTTTVNQENAPSRAQQIVQTNDVLFGSTRPMLKRSCFVTSEYDGQVCSTGFCVLRANKNKVLPAWIFYMISTADFYSHVELFQKGASYPAISDADIKRYEIPLPSLAEQEKIVNILGKFETLCNDMSTGLPAEIAARQKQYEYYRDKLLTFKELT